MVKYHIPLNFGKWLRAGIRLKYLHYRHFFQTSQLSQKMRYRDEILGTKIKDSKVRLYGTNFFELKKNFQTNFFLEYQKISTIQTNLSVFYLSSLNFKSISHFRHFFLTSQLPQKMRYRVEILGT